MLLLLMYPADYGFIPETLAWWNPMGIIGFDKRISFPGCVMEVEAYRCFHMADVDQTKSNLRTCFLSIWNLLNDLSVMNPHLLKEIEHFLQSI
jgi:inorganic pyrophosphatase